MVKTNIPASSSLRSDKTNPSAWDVDDTPPTTSMLGNNSFPDTLERHGDDDDDHHSKNHPNHNHNQPHTLEEPPTPQGGDDAVGVSTTTKQQRRRQQVGGAAVAGGIVGLLVAGPIVGVALGIGVAVAATTKSKAGDVARASGDAVAAVGGKLSKLDKKHHVVEKTSNGIISGCKTITKQLGPKAGPTTTTTNGKTPANK